MADDDYDDDEEDTSAKAAVPDPTAVQVDNTPSVSELIVAAPEPAEELANLPKIAPGIFKFSAIFGGEPERIGRARRVAAPRSIPSAAPAVPMVSRD